MMTTMNVTSFLCRLFTLLLSFLIMIQKSQAQCELIKSINTPYNENDAIPTYVGIMFQIYANMDLDILTFEMDLRIDNTTSSPDLSVDVYMKDGDYLTDVSNSLVWTKVASSTFMSMSSNSAIGNVGAIIPYTQFTPVSILKDSKKSFYITLQHPYIDYNVDALQKTGEEFLKTSDMTLFVGSGFSEPNFPTMGVNTTVDPQFSGVVHYQIKQQQNDCSNVVDYTDIEYQFLFNYEIPPTEVIDIVQNSIETMINQNLQNNNILKSYVNEYSLQLISNETKTELMDYKGGCPSGWDVCPKVYCSAKVKFSNQLPLDTGLVKYEIYRIITESLIQGVAVALRQQYPTIQLTYIGSKAIASKYTARLDNVPGPMATDSIKQYFGSVTTDVLDSYVQDNYARVLYTSVTEQTDMSNTRALRGHRHLQQDLSTMKVQGQILGTQAAALKPQDYQNNVDDALLLGSQNILNQLKMSGFIPSSVNNSDSLIYFSTMTEFKAAITSVDQSNNVPSDGIDNGPNEDASGGNTNTTAPGSSDDEDNSTLIIIIGSVLGGCLLLILLLFCCKAYRNHRDKVDSRKKRRNKENGAKDKKKQQQEASRPREPEKNSSSKSTMEEEIEFEPISNYSNNEKLFKSSSSVDGSTDNTKKKKNLDSFLDKQKQQQPKGNKKSGARSVDDVPNYSNSRKPKTKANKEAEDVPLKKSAASTPKGGKTPATTKQNKIPLSIGIPTSSMSNRTNNEQTPNNTSTPKKQQVTGSPKNSNNTNTTSNSNNMPAKLEANGVKDKQQPQSSTTNGNNNTTKSNIDSMNSYHLKSPHRQPSSKRMLSKDSEDLSHEFRRSINNSVETKPKKKVKAPSLIDYMNQQPKSTTPKGTSKSVG